MNPEPVPISKILDALLNLPINYLRVSACIPGAEIVVFHPMGCGQSAYGLSPDASPPNYMISELFLLFETGFIKYFLSTIAKTS